MNAYLSLGFFNVREQEICSSDIVRNFLIEQAVNIVQNQFGKGPEGILCAIPFCLPEKFSKLKQYYTIQGTRRPKEVELLFQLEQNKQSHSTWCLVLNPAQGWITAGRLRRFVEALRTAACDYCVSTVVMPPNYNILWNSNFVERIRVVDEKVRLPQRGESHIQTFSDVHGSIYSFTAAHKITGSQDAAFLEFDDNALYAVRTNMLNNFLNQGLPEPHPVCDCSSEQDDRAWFMRLPLFQTSNDCQIDITVLEDVLRSHVYGK